MARSGTSGAKAAASSGSGCSPPTNPIPNAHGTMKTIEIDSPVLRDGTVTAFKISPDGTRMALVRRTTDRQTSELGLARIIRSDKKIMVNDWRVTGHHAEQYAADQ